MVSVQKSTLWALPTDGEVHCWKALVAEQAGARVELEKLLSGEEARAAARFLRESDRERYVVSHGVLRQLLGGYLGVEPAELRFGRGGAGKPVLVLEPGWPLLEFNLSHSGDLVLIAVAVGRRVGVDVERIRADRDVMEIARAQFAQEEIAGLEALCREEERARSFYGLWTLKEAYVKARGEGLGFPLRDFVMALVPGGGAVLRWVADGSLAMDRWSVFVLPLFSGYAGAVVAEGAGLRLVGRDWARWGAGC